MAAELVVELGVAAWVLGGDEALVGAPLADVVRGGETATRPDKKKTNLTLASTRI